MNKGRTPPTPDSHHVCLALSPPHKTRTNDQRRMGFLHVSHPPALTIEHFTVHSPTGDQENPSATLLAPQTPPSGKFRFHYSSSSKD